MYVSLRWPFLVLVEDLCVLMIPCVKPSGFITHKDTSNGGLGKKEEEGERKPGFGNQGRS